MKKLFLIPLLLVCIISANAQTVNSKDARKVAATFWNRSFSNSQQLTLACCFRQQTDTTLFVYNVGNSGFVVISGDYSVMPVLAYSNEGNFNYNDLAPATVDWMQHYSNQILAGRNNKYNLPFNSEWNVLLSDDAPVVQNKSVKSVNPLCQTRWDQGRFYNYKCPAYPTGPDGHCVTGCVATAMAQIMKYYNYPVNGLGSHYYTHPHFGNIGADFAATTYDWAGMGNYGNLTNQEAIGTLIFHCGVSVDMDYNPTESGAMSENAVTAFKNYFHYRNTIASLEKGLYLESEWITLLKDNLDENHPIMYSGSGTGGGHAWVCDGYDNSDRFHMNWGWSGSSNGYFVISNLNPGGYTFNMSDAAIVNIMPYFAPYCMANRTFTDSTRVISDGSGYSYYWNDTDCDWLITPTDADRVLLQFADFNTETANDIVSVYDGETTASPLLGAFSGTDTPPLLTAYSGKMLITFSSSSATQGLGWTAKYWSLKQGDGIREDETTKLSLYPNPVVSELTLTSQVAMNEAVNVSIYDYSGKMVYNTDVKMDNENTLRIDAGQLNAGFYIVSLQSDQHIYRTKFIKQ
jgi:hypothetical protein